MDPFICTILDKEEGQEITNVAAMHDVVEPSMLSTLILRLVMRMARF